MHIGTKNKLQVKQRQTWLIKRQFIQEQKAMGIKDSMVEQTGQTATVSMKSDCTDSIQVKEEYKSGMESSWRS